MDRSHTWCAATAVRSIARVRPGLTDPATQQAFLRQYDAQLQAVIASRPAGSKANFAATDYFQALPPAGRLPLDAIDTVGLTQTFFPQQMNVQLSIIPADELPAVIEDGLLLLAHRPDACFQHVREHGGLRIDSGSP